MYWLRRWSVRHARGLELSYQALEFTLRRLSPLLSRIGHERLEKPVAGVEKLVKGALFDCQMCGQCVLSSTGMSCPMNCPKTIRNGPCGGVREGGFCEIKPEMRCVWVEAWQGASKMKHGAQIATVQFAVDHRLQGTSSWLRVLRQPAPDSPNLPDHDDEMPAASALSDEPAALLRQATAQALSRATGAEAENDSDTGTGVCAGANTDSQSGTDPDTHAAARTESGAAAASTGDGPRS